MKRLRWWNAGERSIPWRRNELLAYNVVVWITCKLPGRVVRQYFSFKIISGAELQRLHPVTSVTPDLDVSDGGNFWKPGLKQHQWENKDGTYTRLLSDARLSCCCCCCVCCCCCCCCGCWETACCCCHVDTLVGNRPPGDARACRAVISALVSWYSERGQSKQTHNHIWLMEVKSCIHQLLLFTPELKHYAWVTCVVRCGHGGEGQPLCQEAWCGYRDHWCGEALCHLGSSCQPLSVLPERRRHDSHNRNKEPTLTSGLM